MLPVELNFCILLLKICLCLSLGRDVVPGTCVWGYLCLLGGGVVAGGVDAGQGTLLELHESQPTSPQPHIERERETQQERGGAEIRGGGSTGKELERIMVNS